jgi:hypothetical protein
MANLNYTYYQQIATNTNAGGQGVGFMYTLARVVHIVQGPFELGTNIPDPYYRNPTDLGRITFQLLSSGQTDSFEALGNNTAIPINSAFKHYPLPGELVYIIPGPSVGMNETPNSRDYFYFPPYNVWNASHHNAFPNLTDYDGYVNEENRTYQESAGTNQPNNLSSTGSAPFPLGPNFPEQRYVRSLRQFTGDVTIEGRWGNSVRFGSTISVNGDQTTWSRNSEPGNPITIIRNGQGRKENVSGLPNISEAGASTGNTLGRDVDLPWFPTVEDINRDPSSIYLTQGQEIVIDDINNNFSLASLETVFSRTYTLSVPIQQQLTSTTYTSPDQQDFAIQQIGRGVSTGPLPSSVPAPIPAGTTAVEEQRLLLSQRLTPPRRG